MTVATPPSSPDTAFELPPLRLPWQLRLTPDQFELVCQQNPDPVLELSAVGQLIAMTPAGSDTSSSNQTLGALLWMAVDVRAQQRSFAPLCPDLVVELASPSDEGLHRISALRHKIVLYCTNGAQLAWLLLPSGQEAQSLDGGQLFPGLQIDLSEVWQGYPQPASRILKRCKDLCW